MQCFPWELGVRKLWGLWTPLAKGSQASYSFLLAFFYVQIIHLEQCIGVGCTLHADILVVMNPPGLSKAGRLPKRVEAIPTYYQRSLI